MKKYVLLALAICSACGAYSQPNNPMNPVPLDGALILLAVAGVAFAYRVYRKKTASNQEL